MKLDTCTVFAPGLLMMVVACGAGTEGKTVAGKGQAADAAYGLVETKQGIEKSNGTSGSGLRATQISGDGINATNSFIVNGDTGKASVDVTASISSGNVSHTYTIKFDNFSSDGINTYDGELRYEGSVETSGDGAVVREHVVGRCSISGEYAAELDVDLFMEVIAGAGGVQVRMRGHITADGSRFDYDGNVVAIGDDGTISIDGTVQTDPSDPTDPTDPVDPLDPNSNLADCQGNFDGSYRGSDDGTARAVLAGDVFTLTFISSLVGSPITYTFKVGDDGVIDSTSFDLSIKAALDFETCSFSGSWSNVSGGSGTWNAARD